MNLDLRIVPAEQLGHLPARRNQLRRIAGLRRVERAEAVHHDDVPGVAADDVTLALEMPVEPDARMRLERHVVVEAGLAWRTT